MTRPSDLQAIFDAFQRGSPYASLEEVNRLLTKRMHEYNARPQAELGGLSPDTVAQLLQGDWTSEGALRLNERLTLDELAGAAILADARTLLAYVCDEGPVKCTVAGNLPRSAVAALLPQLRMHAERNVGFAREAERPKNEGDVCWLMELRTILMFGGLLVRRKGFRVTSRGRTLLVSDRAGELHALLFRTLFRKFDLRALGYDDRHPGLQQTVAYSFYKLRTAARDWASEQELAESAWLESSKDPPSEWDEAHGDFRYHAFRNRVLDPLASFGLLEHRSLPTDEKWIQRHEYRCSPLFGRFLTFELRGRVKGARR
ncbi:MAG: hypothetical protein JJD97_03245 [Gemmatimonadaceae bacterium]|nr:hypothetical protein [Gemmatimonadaceae bacterium]